ncbi:Ig-like domain-containing protein [Biformimicrobium ophioploci]|nr:Ig-like domain-containing protein [Microbulbifer sp. NKW57]
MQKITTSPARKSGQLIIKKDRIILRLWRHLLHLLNGNVVIGVSTMDKPVLLLSVILIAATLSACGGGGGGSDRPDKDTSSPGGTSPPSSSNSAPVAKDDSFQVTKDGGDHVMDVLSNDSDPDGDELSISDVSASKGSAKINADNTVSYIPPKGFTGQDSGSYTVSDGKLTDTGEITISVVDEGAQNPESPLSISIQWTIPTKRENGTTLDATEIKGYQVSVKAVPSGEQVTELFVEGGNSRNASVGLDTAGTYEVSISTVDTSDIPSGGSAPVTVTIE